MTERRFDPTTRDWITFATHRQNRTYKPQTDFCPLCPTKVDSEPTEIPFPEFEVVVFDNRFPSFSPNPPEPSVSPTPLSPVAPASGRCEVIVYSDNHSLTLTDLGLARIRMLVEVWVDRWKILGSDPAIRYVMPFENKGEIVGTTLSHPHGQIYGYPDIPPVPLRELTAALEHFEEKGTCIYCDVVEEELRMDTLIVAQTQGWIAWVPRWARFPYEVRLAPKQHRSSLATLTEPERDGLAEILVEITKTYDALWGFSLPYIMAFHQSPTDGDPKWDRISHLHVEFAPPHRTRDRLKYLAGSELAGGSFITDVQPEVAAERLRAARAK
ncbi:MAG: galactose-1-phosphate uridylyltransferase [Acidimicrobiales bacterium]